MSHPPAQTSSPSTATLVAHPPALQPGVYPTPQTHTLSPAPSSQFAPRREFIRDQHTFSTFALLALSGQSSVRLYSFPPALISAIRDFFHQSRISASFREDTDQNLCEFTLDGRPWGIAKTVKSEKLIVDLLRLVFRHGFIFLSTIDYGREQDDRIAIAFSKPATSRSGSPLSGAISAAPPPQLRTARVPFAISFSSATVMRVINPPLNSTPAILQAVRGAWPRGVVAEKKVEETCFEFKLKGYKWFQEDTFATDSLRHILQLLAALDMHGFKMLSSLTLTNRSRIKDLWIFTGPSSEAVYPESPPASPNNSKVDLRRHVTPEGSTGTNPTRHTRSSSMPHAGSSGTLTGTHTPPHPGHARVATESSITASSTPTKKSLFPPMQAPRVLRKASPKSPSQLGLATPSTSSLARSPVLGPPPDSIRMSLASDVGSAENMTGIGIARFRAMGEPLMEDGSPSTPGWQRGPVVTEVIYETGGESGTDDSSPDFMQDEDPFRREQPTPPSAPTGQGSGRVLPTPPSGARGPLIPPAGYGPPLAALAPIETAPAALVGPPIVTTPPSAVTPTATLPPSRGPTTRAPSPDQPRTPSPPAGHSSTLLSPGVFRNSAFTTSTGWRSTEIPIQWGPALDRDSALTRGGHDSGVGLMGTPRDQAPISATGDTQHKFPGGGWTLTPVEERRDDPISSRERLPRLSTAPAPAGPRQRVPSAPLSATPGANTPGPGAWELTRARTPERHAVDARISSPHVVPGTPSGLVRQSEAPSFGMIPVQPRPLPAPAHYATPPRRPPGPVVAPVFPNLGPERKGSADGWVVVDVDRPSRPPLRPRSSSDPYSSARTQAVMTISALDAAPQKQGTIRRLFSINRSNEGGMRGSPRKGRHASAGEGHMSRFGSADEMRTGMLRRKAPPEPAPVRPRIKLDDD